MKKWTRWLELIIQNNFLNCRWWVISIYIRICIPIRTATNTPLKSEKVNRSVDFVHRLFLWKHSWWVDFVWSLHKLIWCNSLIIGVHRLNVTLRYYDSNVSTAIVEHLCRSVERPIVLCVGEETWVCVACVVWVHWMYTYIYACIYVHCSTRTRHRSLWFIINYICFYLRIIILYLILHLWPMYSDLLEIYPMIIKQKQI